MVTKTAYTTIIPSTRVIVFVDEHNKPVTTKIFDYEQLSTTSHQASKPHVPKTRTRTVEKVPAIIYVVDSHGKTVSTVTTSTTRSVPAKSPSAKPTGQDPKPTTQLPKAHVEPTSLRAPPSWNGVPHLKDQPLQHPDYKVATSLSAPPSSGSGGPGFSSGVSYSPYNADNSCKSASQVASDFNLIQGFSVIRLYGTDCNQVANVLAASKNKGISLFLGIFDLTNIASECKTITDAVKGDWSHIHTVSVGNELVNNGAASVGQVTAAIGQVRSTLQAAGYHGPVVTVDTMVAMKANPELCHASDYCAINCHAFFDGNVAADGAGAFVLDWTHQVSQAAGGKPVVVTETGWPTQGDPNNKAVPSKPNHDVAIASIKESLKQNVILYSAFNDLWKKDSGATHNAEKFWGILGNAPG